MPANEREHVSLLLSLYNSRMTKIAALPVGIMNGYAYNNVISKEKLFYAISKPELKHWW